MAQVGERDGGEQGGRSTLEIVEAFYLLEAIEALFHVLWQPLSVEIENL